MAQKRDKSTHRVPLMAESPIGDPPLWINERDERDRRAEPAVIEAAYRIWRRVIFYVRGQRNDVSEAAEILEEAVYSVSRAVRDGREQEPVRNLDSYLYHSFVRRFSRIVSRQQRIQYFESAAALDSLGAKMQEDWAKALENEILLEELVGAMDPKTREMFALRGAGHSWKDVGRQFGINAHNAEVQFWYGVKKAKSLLDGTGEPEKPKRRKK